MKYSCKRTIAIFLTACMSLMCLPALTYTYEEAVHAEEAPVFEVIDGQVIFEAEDARYDGTNFVRTTGADMSGSAGLYTSILQTVAPDTAQTGDMEFSIKSESSDVYKIWMRIKPTTSSKTIYVSVNEGAYSTHAIGGTANEWLWTCVTSTSISKGGTVKYKLSPKNGHFTIDKVLVTNNRVMVPDGIDATLIWPDSTIPDGLYNTPTFTPPPEHPRLYFTKDDIPQILLNAEKTENLSAYRQHKNNLLNYTDGILSIPKEGESNTNNTWLGYFESWAFEYAVTGNEELGRRAIDSIKNYMSTVVYKDNYNDYYTRNAGHLIFTVAEVYDWCYPLLTDYDKKFLTEQAIVIIRDGIEIGWPPTKQGGVTGHGSEAQLLRDLLGFAIAVADERPDIYNAVAGRFFDDYLPPRLYHYAGHMFHQGSGYGSYRGQWDYNSTWIFDRMGLERVYGDEQQYAAYWFIYLMRPDGVPFTDGDAGNNGRTPGSTYTSYRRVYFLASNYYKDPYLKYMAQKSGSGTTGYGHGNTSPVEFILFNDPNLNSTPISELPLTKYFGSPMGNMIARTGWNDGLDSNDAIAYMKIGEQWFANHHHLDFGHFQIYYKGLLAADSGRYESYGTLHDGTYNKRTVAHNTILVYDPDEKMSYMSSKVNDGGQRIAGGEKATLDALLSANYKYGEVLSSEFGPDLKEPDYSYLKGDLTNAYSSSKMSNFNRSFMFYNLKDEEHPAVLITFDRVISTNPSFKKSWLLHGVTEPEVNGNRTVFRNDENGYNGKLTVDTLLPKSSNTDISVIGGLNNDFWVNGVNYPSTNADGEVTGALNPTKIHDSDGYRIEVSPKTAATTDYFLNVMQVGESNPDTPALPVTLIETNAVAGAKIADRVCIFSKSEGRTSNSVSFSFSGDGSYKINVADVKAGLWKIQCGGKTIATAAATEEGGLLSFEGPAGSYVLTYADSETSLSLPIKIENMMALSYINDIKVTANISGSAAAGASVILAVYNGEKDMIHMEQVPYTGSGKYEFVLSSTLGSLTDREARLMVWSGQYEALPLASTSAITLY